MGWFKAGVVYLLFSSFEGQPGSAGVAQDVAGSSLGSLEAKIDQTTRILGFALLLKISLGKRFLPLTLSSLFLLRR